MSGLDLISRIFGVGGVQTFEKALAVKGISFSKEALAKALAGLSIPTDGLTARIAHTPHNAFLVSGGYKSSKAALSPQKSLFEFTPRGERISKNGDTIADEIAWMLNVAARQSNPKVASAVAGKAHEGVSEIAKAA